MVGGGRKQYRAACGIGNINIVFLFSRSAITMAMTTIVIMVKILQWNSQSMNAHGFDFYDSMIKNVSKEEKPGIICIQETWYDEYNMIHFPNYYLVNKSRKDRRGGLSIYIHSSITFRVLNTPEDREYQIIDIYLQNCILSLTNFYNPCKKINPSLMDEIMTYCKEHVIVCGDFNSHNSLWGSTSLDVNGKTVEDFMNKYDLVILNDGNPTRLDPHSGGLSCLDLTFMSKELSSRTQWSVTRHNFGSDHFVISFNMFSKTENIFETREKQNIGLSRRHTNIKWELYKKEMNFHFEDIKEKYHDLDIQGKYDLLVDTMIASFDKQRKEKTSKHTDKSPVPWWNEECSRASKERNAAKNRFMYKTFLYKDLEVYLQKKREAQAVFRKAKREYWKNYCEKLNRLVSISSVWKRIKGIKEGSKYPIPNLIMESGKKIAKSAEEKAVIFLQCFNYIGTRLDQEEVNRRKRREETDKNIIDNTSIFYIFSLLAIYLFR